MNEMTTHLYTGADLGGGVLEVASFITLCCKRVVMDGLGTINPDACTCARYEQGGE